MTLDLDDLKRQKKKVISALSNDVERIQEQSMKLGKINSIINNSEDFINAIDYRFERTIRLDRTDTVFLFSAIGLQLLRQFFTAFNERTGHIQSGEKAHETEKRLFSGDFFKNESTNSKRYYYASLQEILEKGVPYDIVKGSKKFNLGAGVETNKGYDSRTHRVKTLGHDPVLGYVFGTCNILTATLTNTSMETYHVRNGFIVEHGDTVKMFTHSLERFSEEKKAVVAAFVKQYLHIKSDEFSKEGIPLPALSVTSEELTNKLLDCHIDYANVKTVGFQVGTSIFINTIITYLYMIYKYGQESEEINEIKAKKIIEYSNLIISSSSIIRTAISRNLNNLDIGGMCVTIHTIVESKKIQSKIKEEFLEKEMFKLINE